MKHIKIKHKGFTLVEILIVAGIVSLLTTFVFINFSQQRKYLQYNNTLTEILSLIKTARSYAISSRAVYDTSQAPGNETYIPPNGYGVYIEQSANPGESSVILFANTNDTGVFENQYDDADIIEESITITGDSVFDTFELINLSPASSTPTTRGVIIFRPPLADTLIADNGEPDNITVEPTIYDTLSTSFYRQGSTTTASGETISINSTSGFPEIELN